MILIIIIFTWGQYLPKNNDEWDVEVFVEVSDIVAYGSGWW